MKKLITILLPLVVMTTVFAETKKTLIIGISGVKPDALQLANTPNLDALVDTNGSISYKSYTGGVSNTETQQVTASGPGWASVLTGVWANKHAVYTNDFNAPNYENYPHFFSRIKDEADTLKVMSITEWDQLSSSFFALDDNLLSKTDFYTDCIDSEEVKTIAIDKLTNDNPDVIFLQFDKALLSANNSGYSLSNQAYINAIQNIDNYIGDIISTIQSRPNYGDEEWVTIATTDHGGLSDGTTGGQSAAERTIFTVVNNSKTQTKLVADYLGHTAIPATVAEHHNIEIDPLWGWETGIFSVEVVPPTGFQTYVNDIDNYIEISWINSVPAGIISFEILRDDVVIATLDETAVNFIDSNLPANVIGLNYEVRMNSIDGVTSLYTTTIDKFEPLAIYEFEENLNDTLGNYNASEEGTVSYIDGIKGKAVTFTGSNSANAGSELSSALGTSDFSISLWVKADGTNHDKSIISNKNWRKGSNRGWSLSTSQGKPHFNFTAENGGRIDLKCPDGQIIHDGNWHHVVASVKRGEVIDLYYDGEKSTSGDISSRNGSVDTGLPIRLGKDGNNDFAFVGNIDDVRIIDYAIGSKYVKSLYESGLKPAEMSGIGNALDFSNGGHITFSPALSVQGNWTVEMWANTTVDYSTNEDGSGATAFTTGSPSLRLEQWNNDKKLGCSVRGSYDHTFAADIPAAGNWTHLAYVHKDGEIALYVNGVKDSNPKSDTRDLVINSIGGDGTLFAQIDEFRVWSEARTAAQISENADNVETNSENLEAYFKFDQSGDNYLFDYSGNGNHGRLVNIQTDTAWTSTTLSSTAPVLTPAVLTRTGFNLNWVGFSENYKLDIATDDGFTSFVTGYNDKTVTAQTISVNIPDFSATYYVRVRGVTNSSATANSPTITVSPALMGTGESFETTIPLSWTTVDTNSGDAGFWTSVTTTYKSGADDVPAPPDGNNFAYCRFDNKASNEDWLILPPVELTSAGDAFLKFKACTSHANYYESFKIMASTSNTNSPSDFNIELADITFATDAWKDFEFDIIALSNGEIVHGDIVSLAINYTAVNKRFLTVDLVQVETGLSSPEPLTVSNIKADSFNLTWMPISGCNYLIDVATDSGFTSILPNWNSKTITTNHITVTNLNPGSSYFVRVKAQANDGSMESEYTATKNINTSTDQNYALYIHDGGANDVVTVGRVEEMESLSQFTVEMWWKSNAAYDNGTRESAFAYRASGNERFLLSTGVAKPSEKSQIWLTIATGGTDAVAKTPDGCLPSSGVGNGQWVHVAAVFDGTATGNENRVKIYLNGVEQLLTFSGTIPTMTTAQSGLMRLGENNFDGTLDEFRFWTVKRTPQQIRDNIYSELDYENDNTGLLIYYDFNLASGDTLYDRSASGNDGTLNSRFFERSSNCWSPSKAIYPCTESEFTSSNPAVIGGDVTSTTTNSGAEIQSAQPLQSDESIALIVHSSSDETVSDDDLGTRRLAANWYVAVQTTNSCPVTVKFSAAKVALLEGDAGDTYELLHSTDGTNFNKKVGVPVPNLSQSALFSTRSGSDIIFADVPLNDGFYTLGMQRATTPAIGLEFTKQTVDGKLNLTWTAEEGIGVAKYAIEKKTENGWKTVYVTDDINGDNYSFVDENGDMSSEYRLITYDSYGTKSTTSVDSPQTKIYLTLNKGWNLLSLPIKGADMSKLHNKSGTIWGWNGTNYVKVELPEPFNGFWVYSEIEETVLVTGQYPDDTDWTKNLNTGWNLRGPYSNQRKPNYIDEAFSWTDSYNNVLEDNILMRGVGYWLFVTQ